MRIGFWVMIPCMGDFRTDIHGREWKYWQGRWKEGKEECIIDILAVGPTNLPTNREREVLRLVVICIIISCFFPLSFFCIYI